VATARLGEDLRGEPRIIVSTQWNEKELIKQVPGSRWDPREMYWTLPLSWSSCITLRGVFGDLLRVDTSLNDWARQEKLSRINIVTRMRTQTAPDLDTWDKRLYDFQAADVEFLIHAGDSLLANDMGTGKTISALTTLRTIPNSLPALVICPNSVKSSWEREAHTWFPEANVYVVAGTPKVKERLFDAAITDAQALVVINIEAVRLHSRLSGYGSIRLRKCRDCDPNGEAGLRTSQCEVHPKILNLLGFRSVILDEAHRIKDPHSKQTRACWAVMHQGSVQRRWAMTGTPIANDPSDLWSIMHAVNKNDFPSRSKFIDRYCLQSWNAFGGLSVVGTNPQTRDEFYKILDPRFRRMPKELVLPQLPKKLRQTRYVYMSPKQEKAYKEIEENFVTMLGDRELLTAPSNLAVQVRLMQLASSYCTVEMTDPNDPRGWKVTLIDPSPKVDELIDILDDLGDKPVVVAAEHRQLIELAAKRLDKLGIKYGLITGAQNTFQRDQAKEQFQAGNLRVLLFTVKAGGTGITLTKADTIIFLQRSWSMIDNLQSEDRVHRIGSEGHENITVIDVVTKDTLEDMRQIPKLYEKFQRLEEIRRDRKLLESKGMDVSHLVDEETQVLSGHLGV
jgi:SNF2 family DNA or RNA helicase